MDEEQALHLGLAVLGAPLIALDAIEGGTLGARATLAIFMVVLGCTGIARKWLQARRVLPRARVRRR